MLQSIWQIFNLRKHCLLCGEEWKDNNPRNSGRWRSYYLVRTVVTANNTPFNDFIWKICLLRNDTVSKEVKLGVKSAASDVHGAEVHYQKEWKTNFLHSSYLGRLAKAYGNDIVNALPSVTKFLKII